MIQDSHFRENHRQRSLHRPNFEPLYLDGQPPTGDRFTPGEPSTGTFWERRRAARQQGAISPELKERLETGLADQLVANILDQRVQELKEHFETRGRQYCTRVDILGAQAILGMDWQYRPNYSGPGRYSFALRESGSRGQQTLMFDSVRNRVELSTTIGGTQETLIQKAPHDIEREGTGLANLIRRSF